MITAKLGTVRLMSGCGPGLGRIQASPRSGAFMADSVRILSQCLCSTKKLEPREGGVVGAASGLELWEAARECCIDPQHSTPIRLQ